jgi:hypothetical protein
MLGFASCVCGNADRSLHTPALLCANAAAHCCVSEASLCCVNVQQVDSDESEREELLEVRFGSST